MICTVFWDGRGLILFYFLETGVTVNSYLYVKTFTKLKARIARIRPEMTIAFGLEHDNARLHINLKNKKCVAKIGWMVLPQAQYNHDLSQSDSNLLEHPRDKLRGYHSTYNDAVINVVKK